MQRKATRVQCTRTALPRREREVSRDAAAKGLLTWTAESERTPGAQDEEGGKIRGLLALGQEQSAGAVDFRLSAIGKEGGQWMLAIGYELSVRMARRRSICKNLVRDDAFRI